MLAMVVADGLSSFAAQSHAVNLLRALREALSESCTIAPIVIAVQSRVALADEVGEILGASLALSLIGERPGLSSPDSLGAYLTYAPRVGRNDAERNCISNIRPQGLSFELAARQLAALINAMLAAKTSGVALRFDPSKALSNG
jgi:ethanolamine ammonia-lyase small subunit